MMYSPDAVYVYMAYMDFKILKKMVSCEYLEAFK